MSDRQKRGRLQFLALAAGLLLALAFSTHSTSALVWVALVPWFYCLYHTPSKTEAGAASAHQQTPLSSRSYAYYSWLMGMGFYIGVIHWLKELHPLTWLPGVTTPISYLIVFGGILGISLVVSLWTLLMGFILGKLKPVGWQRIVYPALLWMAMEYAQALGDVSLPWARLAISQYRNLWLLQIVPVTGQLLISGLIVAFNAALACFILEFVPDKSAKSYWHFPSFRRLSAVSAAVLLCLSYGALRLSNAPEYKQDPQGLFTGLMQGNIPQGQKWDSDQYWDNIAKIQGIYESLNEQALELRQNQQNALLIWPESAIPIPLRKIPLYQERFTTLAQSKNMYLLSGIFDVVEREEQRQVYNAAVLVEPDGQMSQWYYKRQLVPFGEFFPYRNALGNIPLLGGLVDMLNPMKNDTSKGRDAGLFRIPLRPQEKSMQPEGPQVQAGTLICFESVYPQVARASVQAGANLLVVITNDGWYRDAIALYQHLGHAVLRALENKRSVLRAGNTGISALIDPYGRILEQSRPMERSFLHYNLPESALHNELTPFTRFGDWPLLLLFIIPLMEWRQRQKQSTTQAPDGESIKS